MQDAILELCVDVLLLHGVAHIEAAGTGAGECLAADVAAIVVLLVIRVAAHCLNSQIAVVQFHLNVFLLAARQVNSHIVAVLGLLDIGLHHVCTALAEGFTLFTVHRTLQRAIVPERIKEIIEQILMENSRHKHKSFLQSRRSGRVKNLYVVHSEKLSGELLDHLAALSFALTPEHAIVIAPFISSVKRRVPKFTKR